MRAWKTQWHGEPCEALALVEAEVQAPTTTLDKFLEENGGSEIDFLSMDIERFRPELVCIEAAKSTRERIRRYFESHGYRRIEEYLERDSANWYFEPKKG